MASPGQSRKISDSKGHAVWLGTIILGAVAMYGWLISPHVGYLHAMQQLEPVVDEAAAESDRIDAGLEQKRQRVREMDRQCREGRQWLFTAGESRSLVHELNRMATEAGCVLVTAGLVPEPDGRQGNDDRPPIVEDIHAILTVQGSYDQVAAMLEALRNGRRRIWVDTCYLELYDPTAGRFECQLELTAFAAVDPESG